MGEPDNSDDKTAPRDISAPGVSLEKRGDTPPPAAAPIPAAATVADRPTSTTTARKLTRAERREEAKRGRRQADAPDERKSKEGLLPLHVPTVTPGSRTENVIAVFLLGLLVGCAGIWIEHDRCPGALKTAAFAAAPAAMALGTPIGVFLAWIEKHATREVRTRRAVLFGAWSAASAMALSTAGLLGWNERAGYTNIRARCLVSRRETVPAPTAGVQDWIVVVSCSDRMSLVRIDVDRTKWWANEPGSTVEANLARGSLGYDWVLDVPTLGPPKRSL